MGHRALHAVERPGGRYDCYRTQWDGLTVFDAGPPSPDPPGSDATAVVADVPADGVLARVDPASDEALFVHDRDGSVAAYLVHWTGIPTTEPGVAPRRGVTALVPVVDGGAADRLDRAIGTAKAVLGDAVDAGLIARETAERYLRQFVASQPDVPEETLWFPAGVT